jgi:glycosyltransferase involved in cell wall biosynthesis
VAEERVRVLVVGPLGGATGGVAMFTETLLGSRLRERFELLHLDTTRSAAGTGKAATLSPVNFLYFFRQLLSLAWLLARFRPRILHQPVTSGVSFWKEAAFLDCARLFGTRVVAHLHGARFREFFEAGGPARRRLVRQHLRRAHRVIVLSAGWEAYLLQRVDARLKTAVVANPIERDFAGWAEGIERDYTRQDCTVLFLGRLAFVKGILTAFAAIPEVQIGHPGTRFVFAGGFASDRERAAVEASRARLPQNASIVFPGLVAGAEKRDWFARADVLMLPSSHENLPIVVLEALAAGLPLVVTPVGALQEFLVEGEHALFVPPGDPAALAHALAQLVTDPAQRARMGAANRRLYAERFDAGRILDRIEGIYRETLA